MLGLRVTGNQARTTASEKQQLLYKDRTRESLPWLASPMKALTGQEFKSFHVRHEASLIELFFDLFFVANLATFTANHEITNSHRITAYIGFFGILWSTWFQVTIFDVRFAIDSVYERFCKLFQFMVFVLFAAVGTYFSPKDKDASKNYRIYQTLAVLLAMSRWLLAIQYGVVACFVVRKHKKLILPFLLIIATLVVSGTIFFLMQFGFQKMDINKLAMVWWVTLPIEAVAVVTISSIWRMLSFKQTHLNERLSLLTLIIIGEGVIGVSKTVGKLWPSSTAPDSGAVVAILSIVILLVLLWQAYFDNHPQGHYGTIRQQWWALLHFFLHLGYDFFSFQDKVLSLCDHNYSNEGFVTYLNATLQYLKVEKYAPLEYSEVQAIFDSLLDLSVWPDQDMCTSPYAANYTDHISILTRDAIMAKFDIEPSTGRGMFYHTFRVTYIYYWSSLALSLFTLLIFLWVVRRHHWDRFEWIRISWRLAMAIIALLIMLLNFIEKGFMIYITSPAVVTTVVVLMAMTLVVDRSCRYFGLARFQRHYHVPIEHEDSADDYNHDHASLEMQLSKKYGVVTDIQSVQSGPQTPQPGMYPAGHPVSYIAAPYGGGAPGQTYVPA